MKTSIACAALVGLVAANTGYVALPIYREKSISRSIKTIVKNPLDGLANATHGFYAYDYYATLDVGSPKQPQRVSIDTSSSDLWFYGPDTGSPYTYDHAESSTSEYIDDVTITYYDDTNVTGSYYKDTVDCNGTPVNVQFAETDQNYTGFPSVLGIANKTLEAASNGTYSNFPYALKEQGLINSVAYSLYLNDVNSDNGTLLFGAVDTSKYTGPLKLVNYGPTREFFVNFELYGNVLGGVLDSGSPLSYINDELLQQIATDFDTVWDNKHGGYKAQGSTADKSLTFNFGGVPITVGSSELFIEPYGPGNGEYLTILPYSMVNVQTLLGQSFLRSAYVVYDLANYNIAVGQANLNPGPPNYEVITDTIPGAI